MHHYKIIVEGEFDAAHQLPFYSGPCSRLHGHRWKVAACWHITAEDPRTMALDFRIAKQHLQEVISAWDHQNLNEVIHNAWPTAEMIAFELYHTLIARFPQFKLEWVMVEEGPQTRVYYSEDEERVQDS